MKRQRHRYTWKPDLPDHRDHAFSLVAPETVAPLPPSVDLRPKMSPVEDQGNLGSCVGNAVAGALEYLEPPRMIFVDISRLFIYYQARKIEHDVANDDGCEIRDAVKACAKVGYCSEKLWPYKVRDFAKTPSVAAVKDAAKHKITEYLRLDTMTQFKTALANGSPVVFGFSVYESFESAAVEKTGVVPMPGNDEGLLGGHAVLMVGYDDTSARVICRNSWSASWGDKGYFTMPYGYVEDRNLSDDFWVIRK